MPYGKIGSLCQAEYALGFFPNVDGGIHVPVHLAAAFFAYVCPLGHGQLFLAASHAERVLLDVCQRALNISHWPQFISLALRIALNTKQRATHAFYIFFTK
jgi:hypothetical protein